MLWLCFGWMAKYSKLETLLCKYTVKHLLSQPVNKNALQYSANLGLRNSTGRSEIKRDTHKMHALVTH